MTCLQIINLPMSPRGCTHLPSALFFKVYVMTLDESETKMTFVAKFIALQSIQN